MLAAAAAPVSAAAGTARPQHQRHLSSSSRTGRSQPSSTSRSSTSSTSTSRSSSRRSIMSASPTSAAATDAGATTRLPRIVAFDLDGTLWDPELYQLRGGAPFRRDAASGAVFDAAGERMRLLGDSAKIISTITTDPAFAGVEIAYVSRTEYPEWAVPCLQTFLIPGHPDGASLFDVAPFQEIYPGSKLKHFRRIHEESGVPYESMLFYDNESWNVKEVSKLGVKCVYTPRGMTAAAWQEGLAMFENSSSKKGVKARKGGR